MNNASDEARELLEQRLLEINEESRRLGQAVKALQDSGRRHGPSSGLRTDAVVKTRKGGVRKQTGRRAAKRGQRPAEVLAYVGKHPETTATQVAEAIGISVAQVHGLVGRLRKAGKLAKESPLRLA